jgi:ATP-dependent Zn protease
MNKRIKVAILSVMMPILVIITSNISLEISTHAANKMSEYDFIFLVKSGQLKKVSLGVDNRSVSFTEPRSLKRMQVQFTSDYDIKSLLAKNNVKLEVNSTPNAQRDLWPNIAKCLIGILVLAGIGIVRSRFAI